MSHVTGYIDGVAYTAVIDPEIANADPDAVGIVTGSVDVLVLLHLHKGIEIGSLPGRDSFTLDVTDERSVVMALHALTTVHEVSDDAPSLDGDDGRAVAGMVH